MWMLFLGLKVTEWIAILTFLGGIAFAVMKFYHLFNKMLETLDSLNEAINNITTQNADHEKRLTIIEQKLVSLFKIVKKENVS